MGKNTQIRPPQIPDVSKKIKECIDAVPAKYIDTYHAKVRSRDRDITLQAALYVLKTGIHERKKTTFDPVFQCWKYAIRGQTIEGKDVRVIVSFTNDDGRMVIITVIDLKESKI